MKAVILAGGLGTRLRPLTLKIPKPMLPLGRKPILEHLIEWNRRNDVKSIVLCVSYRREKIMNHFGDGKKFGVDIEYAISKSPLATAGQLKTAEEFVDDTFVCAYGDSVFDFSLRSMIRQHRARGAFATMGLYEYRTNLQYGVIHTSKTGRVTGWEEKPEVRADINMGCYVMEPGIFRYIPRGRSYGMDDLVKKAIKYKRPVSSFVTKKGFLDIGNMESYRDAEKRFAGGKR